MRKALAVILIFNVFDAVATAYGVKRGYAVEMNPLMAFALEHGVWAFMLVKVLMVSLLSALVLRAWRDVGSRRAILWTVRGVAAAYVLLGIWHVVVFFVGRTL